MKSFSFQIATDGGNIPVEFHTAQSVVLIGANGAGKTRLGALIEVNLGQDVHRISAHRSLAMNTNIEPGSFERAEKLLFSGQEEGQNRPHFRWQGKPATAMLTDFDHVIRALYAEENKLSVEHRQKHRANPAAQPPESKLDKLKKLWEELLPHRELVISAATIEVRARGAGAEPYSAAELSDGERVIFYLLGQTLLLKPDTVFLIDEPELHIHKAILAKLWDSIESARRDCAFVYLTHDLDFAASRHASIKIALLDYRSNPDRWVIKPVPENTGMPEEVVAKILGSRQAILFVEGDAGSLDGSLYRRIYSNFTVIPVGPCDSVIHSVASFKANAGLHRYGCAGLIDADDRSQDEIGQLAARGVFSLPVSEIENLILLPDCFKAVAKALEFDGGAANAKLDEMKAAVFKQASADLDRFALDYTKRRIDRILKAVGLAAKDIKSLHSELGTHLARVDATSIYAGVRSRLESHIKAGDYNNVLALYDNKGLLSEAARILGMKGRAELESLIGRILKGESRDVILAEFAKVLPQIAIA